MVKKEDRRIQRTKQALQRALIDLILDKGYEDINVQNIVDRANIGRSTFYTHYSTKDAVFFDSFRALEISLQRTLENQDDDPNQKENYHLKYTGSLFSHVDSNRHLYRALTGRRGGILAANHIRKILFDLVSHDFENRPRTKDFSNIACDATVHYVVGAITGVLFWWVDHKTQWSSYEVNEFLTSMIAPNLKNIFADES